MGQAETLRVFFPLYCYRINSFSMTTWRHGILSFMIVLLLPLRFNMDMVQTLVPFDYGSIMHYGQWVSFIGH